jgi:DnaK suppressor protein
MPVGVSDGFRTGLDQLLQVLSLHARRVRLGCKFRTALVVHKKASMSGTDGDVDVAEQTVAPSENLAAIEGEPTSSPRKAVARKKAGGSEAHHKKFLESQRETLLAERADYIGSAEALKAQADSLALEHEPGDVQFDEEGGEGGTANVDREIDLYLSAQARATVAEIDRALAKIDDGTYGICEHCGQPIPEARLEALPYAALCVACKSGGLSSRR